METWDGVERPAHFILYPNNSRSRIKEHPMGEEIWKDIIGYEGLYQVSNFGRIKNKNNLIMSLSRNRSGPNYRYMVWLSKQDKKKPFLVHRLVAEAFIPNPNEKPTVNHIDGNPLNNHLDNLEWATKSENHIHRVYVLKEHSLIPCRKVRCIETGVIYPSLSAASRATNTQQSSISQAIRGYRGMSKANNYHWEYID